MRINTRALQLKMTTVLNEISKTRAAKLFALNKLHVSGLTLLMYLLQPKLHVIG